MKFMGNDISNEQNETTAYPQFTTNALQSINLDVFTAYFTSLVSHFKEARLYILFYMVTKNQRMEHFLKQTLYKPGEVSGQPKILITSSLLNPESHFL